MFEGAGRTARCSGLFFGETGQQFDAVTFRTIAGHIPRVICSTSRPCGPSSIGLLRPGARRPEARGSDANQENRNLLLSEHAKADSDPVLEILTSEVTRCGHGATVGPVDEEQLFYLQCRGLRREDAERLLVEAFFTSVIQRVPVVQVRSTLERAIRERLAA